MYQYLQPLFSPVLSFLFSPEPRFHRSFTSTTNHCYDGIRFRVEVVVTVCINRNLQTVCASKRTRNGMMPVYSACPRVTNTTLSHASLLSRWKSIFH